ncbi:MAG: exodeoxyribonuclease VII large subunit [Planctomycetes bacterium]|nr:exodeoxyribonuclease VII large subunit [Planctomycetota bacterium]
MHDAPGDPGPRVLTVTELNDAVKDLLGGLGRVAVEGEVAGLRRPASGHVYFNLKDRRKGIESVLGCAIWRSQVSRATKEPLREGQHVVAHGRLDVYAPRGTYSLIVERVEPRGLGALLEELERTKRELREQGWFDRARPLPRLPRVVGVVTSRDGAAFQDFLRTRSLRWPGYPVRLVHTPVQGPGAAAEIAGALADLDRSGVDVIVVTRGGGSLEDLWCFNERVVAEAVWAASVPVVSGVGHETDVTLCDLVADHRAHTPTDAAQTVIPLERELEQEMERRFNYLLAGVDEAVARRAERLERAARSRTLRGADWILGDRARALAGSAAARARRAATWATPTRRCVTPRARFTALGPRVSSSAAPRACSTPPRAGVLAREALRARRTAWTRPARAGGLLAVRRAAPRLLDHARRGRRTARLGARRRAGRALETRLADGTLESEVAAARPDEGAAS